MQKVIHYKTKFLNKSETFIARLIHHHKAFTASALCYHHLHYTDGLKIFQVPDFGPGKLINFAAFHLNLPLPYYQQTLSAEKPDLIHAHFGYDAHKMIGPSKKTGIPLVSSFYGSDVTRLPTEFDWKRRYQNLAEHGSHFIAASNHMKNQLIELGFPEQKISVIYFGLNLSKFKFREQYKPDLNCMMVGRMVEKKGFAFALKAISELKKRGLKLTLSLYGDGPLRNSLESLAAELEIGQQVTFHGFVPVETVNKAMDQHSILLAPSVTASDGDEEGLPNTILEAMARGLPVIATRHAAIPEAVEDNVTGFLANEQDFMKITEIAEQIHSGSFNLEMIRKNARKKIEQNHSIEKMVVDVEEVYKRVLF